MLKTLRGLLGILLTGLVASAGADDRLFREQVAPVLETRCVSCHSGPAPKGKLALTTAAGLKAGGEGGEVVVPGQPEESLLLESVLGEPPAMPRTGRPLEPSQVAALRTWIEQGAHWPEGLTLEAKRPEPGAWWAFQPLARPALPEVKRREWCRANVDALVLASLESKGLSPRPEADRRTLIRRLTFNLHGLPPTPAEIDDFLADPAADAYERLVDRLLASPRYGERWGRYWLDIVHYGDTHGYDKDKRRNRAWPYRDYVIQALNDDLPYDRFIREQIAGDVLWPGDPRGVIATGFVVAGPWDFVGHVELREGTVDKEKARLNDRDDMLASTMSTFQSLTVHCARCHDHKFDPIPQTDYYRLQAVFAGVDRGERPYLNPEATARLAALESRQSELGRQLASLNAQAEAASSPELVRLQAEVESWQRQLTTLTGPSRVIASPTNGYHSGISAKPDVVKWVQVDLGRSRSIEAISLTPARPTDYADTPGFGFPTRFRIELADEPTFAQPRTVADHSKADVANPGADPWIVRPDRATARYVRVTATKLWERKRDYVLALGELEVISEGELAEVAAVTALDSIEAGRWARAGLIDGFDSRVKLDGQASSSARLRLDLQSRLQAARAHHRTLKDSLISPETRDGIERAQHERASLEAQIKVVREADRVYTVVSRAPRPIYQLNRGDVEQPGLEMSPGALTCLAGRAPDFHLGESAAQVEGNRRAALADWIASPRNVLTWRSIANRVWQGHFGRGLVDTPNDFGRNGSLPTHPELLDLLALELLENGQSLKGLHRSLVLSATYRQSSTYDPTAAAVDADNRHLWRMPRARLDAEELRDTVLSVSGMLDSKPGGPGFEPFRFQDDHSPIYDHTDPARSDAADTHRRTIYRFIVRSVPHPFLESLDCADPNLNTPVRATTISPLQALALLNDRFMIRQSQAFARRLEATTDNPAHQIDEAYRLALGRLPWEDERQRLTQYAGTYGLAAACRLVFNMNEFMFVD